MEHEILNADLLPRDVIDNGRNGIDSTQRRALREKRATRLRLLWHHRRFLLRVTVVGLAISTLAVFVIPKRYTSVARLMPPDQSNSGMAMLSSFLGNKPGSSGASSNLGSVAGDLLGIKNSGDLFVGILKSQAVEDDLINKFDLRKIYRDRYYKDAREDLEDKTEASVERKSGIIEIEVTDKNPQRAAAMVQEYVEMLNRVVVHANTSSAGREREFLEGRLVQVKNDLENAEKGFSQFASKNTALDIPEQGKAMIEAGAALEGQLVVAQTEYEELRQMYSDENVRVRSVKARVEELEKQLQKMGGTYDTSPEFTAQDGQMIYPSARKLPALGVMYADRYREMKVQEAIFETLTQEYELAKVQEIKETPTVKMIDVPQVPDSRSFPPRLWPALLGMVLFFAAGIEWIFLRENWQRIDEDDPGKMLAMDMLEKVRSYSPLQSRNGFGLATQKKGLWKREASGDNASPAKEGSGIAE